MDETLQELAEHISGELGSAIVASKVAFGELTLTARADDIVKVLRFLRDEPTCKFCCFIDICGADYPARENRFDVVYHLLSPYNKVHAPPGWRTIYSNAPAWPWHTAYDCSLYCRAPIPPEYRAVAPAWPGHTPR